jgi:hypothetical protein
MALPCDEGDCGAGCGDCASCPMPAHLSREPAAALLVLAAPAAPAPPPLALSGQPRRIEHAPLALHAA